MAVSLKHAFTSAKSDGGDATKIQPSNWNAEHTLTLDAYKLLGRGSGAGAAQEITYTAFAATLLDDADAATARATLGVDASVGTVADQTLYSNISGGVAAPSFSTVTAVLDDVIGTSRGRIAVRGASVWGGLAVGTNGQVLKSDGTDVVWGSAVAVEVASVTGNSGKLLTNNGSSTSWVANPLFMRATITLSGGVPTIQSSSNLASIVRQTTGVYRFTFTTAAASLASYTVVANGYDSTYSAVSCYLPSSDRNASYFDLRVAVPTIGNVDPETLEVIVSQV